MNNEAITQLDHFGFLSITGRDAQKFLQGYVTCDLEKLEQEAMRGAICNIKGRMVSNFLVCRIEDGLLLRLSRDLLDPTLEFLKKYIVFSKAEMQNKSDQYNCYGIWGNKLAEQSGDLPTDLMAITHTPAGVAIKIADERFELWATDQHEAEADTKEWQRAEIDSGVIWVDSATSEEYIPQMLNLHNIEAISFDKGCYLGQEIVARMQYRGELKKRLHVAQLGVDSDARQDDEALAIGAKILNGDGKNVGNIVARSSGSIALVLKAGEPTYTLQNGTPLAAAEAPSS